MAQQVIGRVYIGANNIDTYNHWRAYCLTHAIDFDGIYQNQCVDPLSLLWYQYGLTFSLGGTIYAYNAWRLAKDINARSPFVAISNITDIKRGDAIVFAGDAWSIYGHVAFADADYSNAFYDYNGVHRLACLGQNQGQGSGWGTPSNIANMNIDQAIGAFRNTNWQTAPPPPSPVVKKKKGFPWWMIARRLRGQE